MKVARIAAWLFGAASALVLLAVASVMAPPPGDGGRGGPVSVAVELAGAQMKAPSAAISPPVAAPVVEEPPARIAAPPAVGAVGQVPPDSPRPTESLPGPCAPTGLDHRPRPRRRRPPNPVPPRRPVPPNPAKTPGSPVRVGRRTGAVQLARTFQRARACRHARA